MDERWKWRADAAVTANGRCDRKGPLLRHVAAGQKAPPVRYFMTGRRFCDIASVSLPSPLCEL